MSKYAIRLGVIAIFLVYPAMLRAQDSTPPSTFGSSGQEPKQVEISGELEISIEDFPGGQSRTQYVLNTAMERLPLIFSKAPADLWSGSRVQIRGTLVDGSITVDSLALNLNGGATATAGSAIVQNTFGPQNTLVMLVNFQDNPTRQPWTVDQIRNFVFGPVSDYFFENSYQQSWLTGDVFGWYTIPLNSTVCDEQNLRSFAEQAASSHGANLNAYSRYLYIFPSNACQYSGSSTVGGSPSKSLINGDVSLGVVAHELGHGFGLYHSHAYEAGGVALEYGDTLDLMGSSRSAHLNAFQKERLGWLNYGGSPPIATVQTTGTYVMDLYELSGSNPKALKVYKGLDPVTGKGVWYYLEYRQAVGFDAYIGTVSSLELDSNNILNGVLIHTGSAEESGNTSFLLDMTPETYHLYTHDPALVVGRTFSDPIAGVTITPEWVNSFSAGVQVSFNQTCVHRNPGVSLSPSIGNALAGASLSYSVSVANNDTGCGVSNFDLQASLPSGWTAVFATPAITINSATSNSTTLTVISPVSAAPSSYTFTVTAAQSSYTGSATATYAVLPPADANPPAVIITNPVNGATVPRNKTMTITADAADDSGIAKVEFYVGNKLIATDSAAPYQAAWKVPGKVNASYLITAVAYDLAGNSASSTVSVTAK